MSLRERMKHMHKTRLVILAVLLIIPGVIALIAMPFVIAFGSLGWGWAALRSFDRFVNVLVSKGSEFQTVSGHCWDCRTVNPIAAGINWFLDRIEAGHCKSANKHEMPLISYGNLVYLKDCKYHPNGQTK